MVNRTVVLLRRIVLLLCILIMMRSDPERVNMNTSTHGQSSGDENRSELHA